jgi:hypothetical protein
MSAEENILILLSCFLELGAHLGGQDHPDGPTGEPAEEDSKSGVSTVNSNKSQKTVDSFPSSAKFQLEYREQMGILKAENMR